TTNAAQTQKDNRAYVAPAAQSYNQNQLTRGTPQAGQEWMLPADQRQAGGQTNSGMRQQPSGAASAGQTLQVQTNPGRNRPQAGQVVRGPRATGAGARPQAPSYGSRPGEGPLPNLGNVAFGAPMSQPTGNETSAERFTYFLGRSPESVAKN